MSVCGGQLTGPFKANEELYGKIRAAAPSEIKMIKHLGVQGKVGSTFVIDNTEFEIGNTGIFEIEQILVNSLYFKQDNNQAIIDYIIQL